MIKHFSLRFSLFLIAIDAILVVVGLLVATGMRIVIPLGMAGMLEAWILPIPVYVIAIVIHNIVYSMLNVHDPRKAVSLLRELQVTVPAAVLAWLMFLGALYLSYRDVSRLQIIYFIGVHLLLIVLSRVLIRTVYDRRGKRRMSSRNVLILGTNSLAHQMHTLVRDHAYTGLHPVGLVTLPGEAAADDPLVIGALDQLDELIIACHVTEVIVAPERDIPFDLPGLIRRLQALPVNIRMVPQYSDLAFLQIHIEDFSGMPLLTLKEPVLTPYQRMIKRGFDLLITGVMLVPALPLMGIIALLIKRDSPGPVLFRQKRIGEGGKPFEMLKFRSMVDGAEWLQERVIKYDENGNPIHKHRDDPRVTRVGRVLRSTSLDELPQLLNIMRGDMSLVGPRPELPDLVDNYQPWQRKRFEVPQGLTGWWQINGRANKPMHLSTEDDLFYIRNYSLWLDILILWRTVWVVLSRRGAF